MSGRVIDMRNNPTKEPAWRSCTKKVILSLPEFWQMSLYRIYYMVLIKRNMFVSPEPEVSYLHEFISSGDWVIDIGANVGVYTKIFSDLVGNDGRVISIEPVLRSFFLLSSNTQFFRYQNVTLLNFAASDAVSAMDIDIPLSETGRVEYGLASLTSSKTGVETLTMCMDDLALPNRVTLVKIDVEGHENHVIKGMMNLIRRDHPVMIVETQEGSVIQQLKDFGYHHSRLPNSPNIIFQ